MSDIRLGLVDVNSIKPPVIQFLDGEWRVWTAYNQSLTLGTYMLLKPYGGIEQVTVYPDGTIASCVLQKELQSIVKPFVRDAIMLAFEN